MEIGTNCNVVSGQETIKQPKLTEDNLQQTEDLSNYDLYDGHLQAEEGFSQVDIDKRQPEGAAVAVPEHTQDTAAPALFKNKSDQVIAVTRSKSLNDQVITITQPHKQLPKPEAPPGLFKPLSPMKNDDASMNRSQSLKESLAVDVPAIGKFIRDRSNSWSSAIARKLSSFKEKDADYVLADDLKLDVTQINLNGLKVIVKLKSDEQRDQKELKGRISFFSRSNCRDCRAVRSFFRESGLKFVEINIDVYPQREKELVEKTGSTQVPQIFFNENLFGGLVALNSLRNSGDFSQRVEEMLRKKCTGAAPAPPVYGFDDPEEESADEMLAVVRVVRQRLPIQDRLLKMKIVKNCFAGSEMVEVLIHHLDCGRKKAVEIGRRLARRHFIHHVFGENEFEDGNNFYRFLEHEPFIPRCFNYRGSTNDGEPKLASELGLRMTKIMAAILESYASDDRKHLDYAAISKSEEFRRYVNLTQELHRVDLKVLSTDERLTFFLNLYNAMVIHGVIRTGLPTGTIDRRSFYSDFQYVVGGYPYSLSTIKNGILRNNRRAPYSLVKPFGSGDQRLELALPKVNLLVNFGLCDGTRSSPPVRFFSVEGVEAELRCAAREFFRSGAVEVDLERRTVRLTRIIKWFSVDFGQEKDILRWIMSYLDATQAGLLMHLLGDAGPIYVIYQDYDWSVNSYKFPILS